MYSLCSYPVISGKLCAVRTDRIDKGHGWHRPDRGIGISFGGCSLGQDVGFGEQNIELHHLGGHVSVFKAVNKQLNVKDGFFLWKGKQEEESTWTVPCAQVSECAIATWRFELLELRTTGAYHGN